MKFNYPWCDFIEEKKQITIDYHFPIMDFGYLLDIQSDDIAYSVRLFRQEDKTYSWDRAFEDLLAYIKA